MHTGEEGEFWEGKKVVDYNSPFIMLIWSDTEAVFSPFS